MTIYLDKRCENPECNRVLLSSNCQTLKERSSRNKRKRFCQGGCATRHRMIILWARAIADAGDHLCKTCHSQIPTVNSTGKLRKISDWKRRDTCGRGQCKPRLGETVKKVTAYYVKPDLIERFYLTRINQLERKNERL